MSSPRAISVRQADNTVRVIGVVDGDCFITERIEEKHMYRCGMPTLDIALANGSASWGIDMAACRGLIEQGVETFIVLTPTKRYSVPMKDFVNSKESFTFHHRPHRAQYFLPLRCFKIELR